MLKSERVRIPRRQALAMILPYIGTRLKAQLSTVAFIVIYMVLFQILVLGVPLRDTLLVSAGVGAVIIGLAFFLEGLLLGIMPLGETSGLILPQRMPLAFILIFGLVLGVGATFAEPAIGFLRQAGASLDAWKAPLLFALLNRYAVMLVLAIGAGVGIAVLFGVLRFIYDLPMKPFLLVTVPLLIAMTLVAWRMPGMKAVIDLAWDSGAVTTGPVTVPLVLALGVGISRVTARSENRLSGFGVVALASAFPILTVLTLGMVLSHQAPQPMTKDAFLAPQNRAVVESLFSDPAHMNEYLAKLAAGGKGSAVASTAVQAAPAFLRDSALSAVQAILPLSLLLVLTIVVILRERLPRVDEIAFGIGLALVGLFLFNAGMQLGLANIGRQAGSSLPASFTAIPAHEGPQVITNFDPSIVQSAVTSTGRSVRFFYLDRGGSIIRIPYDPAGYDRYNSEYRYLPTRGPLFGFRGDPLGFVVVLLFALLLGVSATMAEPSLSALGITVEDLTVGTFPRALLVRAVAAGVGAGMTVGFAKILWDLPMIWLLVPVYVVLTILTLFSSEEFVAIAWDSAGVTTGPVTVPLVLATGAGISQQMGITEGFGILAMASAFPVLSVLLVGFRTSRRQARALQAME